MPTGKTLLSTSIIFKHKWSRAYNALTAKSNSLLTEAVTLLLVLGDHKSK